MSLENLCCLYSNILKVQHSNKLLFYLDLLYIFKFALLHSSYSFILRTASHSSWKQVIFSGNETFKELCVSKPSFISNEVFWFSYFNISKSKKINSKQQRKQPFIRNSLIRMFKLFFPKRCSIKRS